MNTMMNTVKNLYIIRVFLNILQTSSLYYENTKERIIKYAPNIVKDEIIYFDFETTGLNPFHDKIIEYCFMLSSDDNIQISDIVNPEQKIEKKITDITGIHPDMFNGKTSIDSHILNIYNFINGTYKNSIFSVEKKFLVAHNGLVFDKIFLERAVSKLKELNNNVTTSNFVYIDTLLLARKLLPNLKSHSLASLAKHYNVSSGTHRASSDVLCLKTVYEKMIDELANQNKISSCYYFKYPQKVVDFISY